MSPFEAFQMYHAVKRHFTTKSFDYFKYNGKTNLKLEHFKKRKDRHIFERLAQRQDLLKYLVANMTANPSFWPLDPHAVGFYVGYCRFFDSLSYNVKNEIEELSRITGSVKELIEAPPDDYPQIIRLYHERQVNIWFLSVFADCVGCISYWKKEYKDDLLIEPILLTLQKHRPFLDYDKKTIKKVIVNGLNGSNSTQK